ncbi:16S rRNA (cytidine(1402)-2'-O)-methyltransferase [Palleronia sediminis]|uniref:Ribosomal RNA small subunit methyltransferase I n=1 Tax=Palleronia sediminis TaxID=2547833 RepID=A0A4V6PP89_9RHOB|nr:16S rRNA (cytidine(1402)-2'-O)-methyltransferase [Palleronia sediminis]TDL81939.1 16S rRNA (cytidine(1402)-2'-O)-methyltransferase [Palleronia sediminis]
MSGLAPGLYLVATPIGAARDITLRALDILRDADILAAEDTRVLRKLLEIHGIALRGRTILPYHDHNGAAMRPRIEAAVAEGRSVAFASDAGTPLVADPGYALARGVRAAGGLVTTAPGPSAPLAALSLSGLPSDRFLFAGFLPAADGDRRRMLRDLAQVPATLIFFETARRCAESLAAMLDELGNREAAICRELTKKFEEVRQGRLDVLTEGVREVAPKGEIVIVVDRPRGGPDSGDVDTALRTAMRDMSVKDAARFVAEALGVPRRDVYQRALELGKETGE